MTLNNIKKDQISNFNEKISTYSSRVKGFCNLTDLYEPLTLKYFCVRTAALCSVVRGWLLRHVSVDLFISHQHLLFIISYIVLTV